MEWILFVFLIGSSDGGTKVLCRSSRNEVVLNFTVPELMQKEKTKHKTQFIELSIPEAGITSDIGRPKLPVIRKFVEIPEDAEITVETEVLKRETVQLSSPVYPKQPPVPKIPNPIIEFAMDTDYYTRDEFFPQVRAQIADISEMRGHKVAMIEVYPILYNPSQNVVDFTSDIQVTIRFHKANWGATCSKLERYYSIPYEAELKDIIVNYDYYKSCIKLPSLPIGYLIITPDSWYNTVLPLADWKERKGYHVIVAKLSEIGSGNEDQVRDYIKNAYDTWTVPPTYVLLVGDVDKIGYFEGHIDDDVTTATDLYFSTMGGSGDYTPDLYLFRFSVASTSQLADLVNKTIKYERNDWSNGTDWCKKAYFVASEDDGFHDIAEGTHKYCMQKCRTNGMTCDSLWLWYDTGTGVSSALGDGRSWVMYSGHGGTGGWSETSCSPSWVAVDRIPFVGTFACHCGNYTSSACFSEKMIREGNRGAITNFASSNYSYWDSDDAMQRAMFNAAFNSNITWAMGMFNTGRAATKLHFGGKASKNYYEQYNMMGDGSVDIYWDTPHQITVTHPSTIVSGTADLEVTVKDEGNPVKGALVCARRSDTIFVGYTNSLGQVALSMENTTPCTLQITVTGHNLATYEGTCRVITPSAYVIYLKHSIDDDNFGASSGNNDNVVNPGEIIELSLWIKNIASDTAYSVSGDITTLDAYIAITPASKDYGTIVSGDSAMSATPYVFNVDATTPDSHTVAFDLTCKDLFDSTWWSSFEIMVIRAPDIEVNPDSLGAILVIDDSTSQTMIISNVGTDTLTFEIRETVASPGKGQGGPDAGGYIWIDSDEPEGPTYNWIDITVTGTEITELGDDDNVGPFDIGFSFPFYDSTFTTFRFCANGFISFTSTDNSSSNSSLPHTLAPFNLIAPFWEDLDFRSQGNAYYWSDGQKLVIEYYNVTGWGGSGGPYTFEIILKSDGTIMYQYQTMGEPTNSATVGIQNNDGTIGLEVVCNASYIKNNLAVEISKIAGVLWLSETPISGSIPPGDAETITVKFNSTGLTPDTTYKVWLEICSNDPDESTIYVPVTLTTVDILNKGDVGPVAITGLPDTVFLDSTYSPQADIANFGANPAENFNVLCNIDTSGSNVYTDTKFVSNIEGEDTITVTFADWIVPASEIDYTVIVFTQFVSDTVVSNDTFSITVHGAIEVGTEITPILPRSYKLSQAYPSPGIREITIPYQLPEPAKISLNVYDITGKLVSTLINTKQAPGYHSIIWKVRDIPNGIYFYKLDTPTFTQTKKLIILQ